MQPATCACHIRRSATCWKRGIKTYLRNEPRCAAVHANDPALMAWLITFSPLLYILGAVAFWLFYKSGSLKRDFLLGLAWPIAVPVIVPLSIGRRIDAVL